VEDLILRALACASVGSAELSYRQSRLCRLLGNPIAFTVVSLLAENKQMSTGEIAKAIGRSVPRTSNILAALRLAEVVRYETEGRHAPIPTQTPARGAKNPRRSLGIYKDHIRESAVTLLLTSRRDCHVFPIAKSWQRLLVANDRSSSFVL
jgi:hypothetical protein